MYEETDSSFMLIKQLWKCCFVTEYVWFYHKNMFQFEASLSLRCYSDFNRDLSCKILPFLQAKTWFLTVWLLIKVTKLLRKLVKLLLPAQYKVTGNYSSY